MNMRFWGLAAAVACAAALGVAHGSERFMGVVPCALCLWERWPYRVAFVFALGAAFLPGKFARIAMGLVAATMAVSGFLAAIHVGVEWHLWPSPLPECSARIVLRGTSIAEMLANMPATPAKPCDEPTYLIPGLKVSMAMMNFLFALLFATEAILRTARKPDQGTAA